MEYELEKWDRFISMMLHPSNLENFIINEENIKLFIDQSETKRDSVRQQMIQTVFSLSKEKATELFVQQHQAVLIRLLDTVHEFGQLQTLDPSVKGLYSQIGEHLGFILDFIENYFSKYFNLDERVPTSYLLVASKEICEQVAGCRKQLETLGACDLKLLDMIFDSFSEFCSKPGEPFSYRNLIYRKDLIKELMMLGSIHKEGCIYAAISELLIYMNFNSTSFFNHFLALLHDELKRIASPEMKVERLAWHAKEISQIQVRPGCFLHPEHPCIKDMLVTAIEKEIHYLQAISNGNHAATESLPVAGAAQLLHVPFKGAEIYLLHKAFIDAGGAPGEIYKTLLEKTAPHLSNKTQKGFSADSLCKYSDKVTPELKNDVVRFLEKMIRNIRSYD